MKQLDVHRVRIGRIRLKPKFVPRVSDHAVARYLDRVFGIAVTTDQMKNLRSVLHGPEVQRAIACKHPFAAVGNVKIVLEGSTVATVLCADMTTREESQSVYRKGLAALAKANAERPL